MTRNSRISKHVRYWGMLALVVATGACDSEPDPGDEDSPEGTGGEAASEGSGGESASAGGSASGGADESGGGSPDPSGGAPADSGGASPDGGAPAGDGGDAPGGLGGEGGAAGGSTAVGGTEGGGTGGVSGGSGGAPDDGSGGMSTGGQPAVNQCITYLDRTDENADREITWNFGIDIDEERCLQIRVGQSVTWSGNFNFHPLAGNGGSTPNPILSKDEGSGLYPVSFTGEGTFGFICDAHVEMRGAVRVVP